MKNRTETQDVGTLDCENPALVQVGDKVTRNLGDYNSLTVSLFITMPCAPDADSIRECYRETSELVHELLDEEFQKAYNTVPD